MKTMEKMKYTELKMKMLRGILFAILLLAMAVIAPENAAAEGVLSGTTIESTAVLNYKISGVDQVPVQNTVTFKVDDKVSMVLTANDAAAVTTYPGSSAQAMTFTLTNTGNTTHDFGLATAPVDVTTVVGATVSLYADTNTNGKYDAGTDQLLSASNGTPYIDELAPDTSKLFFVVITVPMNAKNKQNANYAVTVEAYQGGGAGALGTLTKTQADADKLVPDDHASVQIILSDAAGDADAAVDGKYAKNGNPGFTVFAPAVTAVKTSAVFSDPLHGTNDPKVFPGSVVTYTITITNDKDADTATNMTITDSLAEVITAGYVAFVTQYNDGATTCAAGEGLVMEGACKTNAADADNTDWNATGANTITITGLTLNPGQSVTVKFQITIQ